MGQKLQTAKNTARSTARTIARGAVLAVALLSGAAQAKDGPVMASIRNRIAVLYAQTPQGRAEAARKADAARKARKPATPTPTHPVRAK